MRSLLTVALMLGVGGCAASPQAQSASRSSPLVTAERLIDAFYSFDPIPLRASLSDAPASEAYIIYYQGWAQGGNYVVLERKPCRLEHSDEVRCDITVKDDLIAALRTGYHVTDTFHLTFANGRIVKVRTTSNDPPQMDEGFKWLRRERPGIWKGPCHGFFAEGLTPQDCVRAIVKGFAEFSARTSG